MKLILKHLNGGEQYRFLSNLLDSVFDSDYESQEKRNAVIQAIMDEVNKE